MHLFCTVSYLILHKLTSHDGEKWCKKNNWNTLTTSAFNVPFSSFPLFHLWMLHISTLKLWYNSIVFYIFFIEQKKTNMIIFIKWYLGWVAIKSLNITINIKRQRLLLVHVKILCKLVRIYTESVFKKGYVRTSRWKVQLWVNFFSWFHLNEVSLFILTTCRRRSYLLFNINNKGKTFVLI